MTKPSFFYTNTAMANGMRDLFKQLEDRLSLCRLLPVYIAGGMAVHLYTSERVTSDIDAEFGGRVFLPNDLVVDTILEDGTLQSIYLDTNYNSTFALMHEDYLDDAIPVDMGLSYLRLHVLSPVDLAVSKIARLADNDKEDIQALVDRGLTTADEIAQRATSALAGYVGGQAMLLHNLRDAIQLARAAEAKHSTSNTLTSVTEKIEFEQRIQQLPTLAKMGGPAYTLHQKASSAIKAAGAPNLVDWQQVERSTIEDCIGKYGQSIDVVADTILRFSPGASTAPRRDAIKTLLVEISPSLQEQYRNNQTIQKDSDAPSP